MQTKIAAYAFTTLKPLPGIIKLNGAFIQIVDLPGLIPGANEDAGNGRRLLAIIRNCDGIILMHDLSQPLSETEGILNELKKAKIEKPLLIAGNKIDLEGSRNSLLELKKRFSSYKVVGISTITQEGFDELRENLWKMSGLIRVYPEKSNIPIILSKGATVKDFILKIHNKLILSFKTAIISGPSAKFEHQHVGLGHKVEDLDRVILHTS